MLLPSLHKASLLLLSQQMPCLLVLLHCGCLRLAMSGWKHRFVHRCQVTTSVAADLPAPSIVSLEKSPRMAGTVPDIADPSSRCSLSSSLLYTSPAHLSTHDARGTRSCRSIPAAQRLRLGDRNRTRSVIPDKCASQRFQHWLDCVVPVLPCMPSRGFVVFVNELSRRELQNKRTICIKKKVFCAAR